MEHISSRQNSVVKRFRALARRAPPGNAVLLDGEHLVQEALDSAVPLEIVAVSTAAREYLDGLMKRADAAGARILLVTDRVLAAMSPAVQPSGMVAIARCGPTAPSRTLEGDLPLVLMIAGVQDPGNVGAIVRAAEAGGATGLLTGDGTADPFGWKALRGSMGSAFRLPISIRQPLGTSLAAARAAGLRIFAAVPRGGTSLPDCNLRVASAIVVGSEGCGLPPGLIDAADERLTIPMNPRVESLNVAIAAGIILYETRRQRNSR